MAYYMVHKKNPYFDTGLMIELFTEGFQECDVVVENNRTRVVGNKGLLMPEREVKPYCVKMLRKGFDKPELRRKAEFS